MEQMAAVQLVQLGADGVDLLPERRRRPVRSPVSLASLGESAWRRVRPFAPLALLVLVFALSVGVVQAVERVTPLRDVPPAVSSGAPQGVWDLAGRDTESP
jgi:hypothetical protein